MKIKSFLATAILGGSLFIYDHNYLGIGRKIRFDLEHALSMDGIDNNTYNTIVSIDNSKDLLDKLTTIDTLSRDNYYTIIKAINRNENFVNEFNDFKKNNKLDKVDFYEIFERFTFEKGYFSKIRYRDSTFSNSKMLYKIDKKINIIPGDIFDYNILFPNDKINCDKEVEIGVIENEVTGLAGSHSFGGITISEASIKYEYSNLINIQNKNFLYGDKDSLNFRNSIIANELYHHFFQSSIKNKKPKIFDNLIANQEIPVNLFNEFGSDIATLNVDIRALHFMLSDYFSYESSGFKEEGINHKGYKLTILVTGEIYKKIILPKIQSKNSVEIMKELSPKDLEDIIKLYNEYYFKYYKLFLKN